MIFNITTSINKEKINSKTHRLIEELSTMYLRELINGNKVAFYYEDINTSTIISYNQDICFYAASSIKILVCLILFEKATNKEINLNKKILITMKELKQDTGIIKYQKEDTYYTIRKLIELTITESDNTAYLKLVNLIGKEKLKEYGKKIGANHTMEGKDSFGIINCHDMIIYWKKIKEFIDNNKEYGPLIKEYLTNPTVKLISDKSISNKTFVRKYGSWDIAYHEAGYIEANNPYYIIILTQLNKMPYKEKFLNDTAKKLTELHQFIN